MVCGMNKSRSLRGKKAIQRFARKDRLITGILIGLFVVIVLIAKLDSCKINERIHPDSGSLEGYALNVCRDSFVKGLL